MVPKKVRQMIAQARSNPKSMKERMERMRAARGAQKQVNETQKAEQKAETEL